MKRLLRWTGFALRIPVVLYILLFNLNLWTASSDTGTSAGLLDSLTEDLRRGAGDDMQALFPEGFVITHALVGFAWVDVALRVAPADPLRDRALTKARWVLSRVDTDKGRAIFPASISPAYGAFYRGYRAWLRGGILLADAAAPAREVEAFRRDCEEIAEALQNAETPFLESYRGQAWPADSVFLAAALALHDHRFEPRYAEVIDRWVRMVRDRLDPVRGIVPHAVEPGTGALRIAPRGVSSVLLARMLHEVDVELSADQYAKTREHFVDALFGVIPGVREYPKGETGPGDVDSGPLIFGFSLSASVVGIAAARFHGDIAFAGPATIVAHAAGMPLLGRYAFGLMPVGEAFFVWSRSARPWIGPEASSVETAPLVRPGWRFTYLLLGLALCTLLFAPELWRLSLRRGRATPN